MSLPVKKIFQSQKGDAIILLSVLVTGIILLVTVITVEKLRESAELQSLERQSVNSLYQAEEGIEYGLYVNKEKPQETALTLLPDSNVKTWDGGSSGTGNQALVNLAQPTENKDVTVTSESNGNQNNGPVLKRTVFANLPSRYYSKVPLWSFTNGCSQKPCAISPKDNDMEKGHYYQVIFGSADFQKNGWDVDGTQYRLVFSCPLGCRISEVKLGLFPIGTLQGCPGGLSPDSSVDVSLPSGTGDLKKIVVSDWFRYKKGSDTNDLRNGQILVQFYLNDGSMGETPELPPIGGNARMCKDAGGTQWIAYNKWGGLASLEIRKCKNSSPTTGLCQN